MLLVLTVAMLAPSITYATPNQSVSDNFTNATNISEIVENTTNPITIQNTTTTVVNDTDTNQQETRHQNLPTTLKIVHPKTATKQTPFKITLRQHQMEPTIMSTGYG
jgi:hypothetical protein